VSDAPQRRKQTERRQESIQKILDAAEALFAASGFNGTTLNDVAKAIDGDTSLLRYYFTDKDGLFDAILKRRSGYVNAIRLDALNEYERVMGDDLTIEGIIDAFVRPAFELVASDEGWKNYAAIIAYLNSSRGARRQEMSVNFDESALRVIELMQRALPDADSREVFWGYHFLTGSFTFSLGQTGRIDTLSKGKVSSLDFVAITDRLVLTLAAGIRALCTRDMSVPIAEEVQKRIGLKAKA
jgi:AcrR family transcriptional regulator